MAKRAALVDLKTSEELDKFLDVKCLVGLWKKKQFITFLMSVSDRNDTFFNVEIFFDFKFD